MTEEDPERFFGRPAEYLLWCATHPTPFNPLWCSQHWMPCPVEGLNGILASILMTQESFAFVSEHVGTEHTALNSWFANLTKPICCRLGDERMAWLWRFCDNDNVEYFCREHVNPNSHGCWFPKDHDGEHEPLQSIFSDSMRAAWGQEPFPPL